MNKKKYESEGLYRFRIIAPLINETFAHGELKKKLKELSKKFYEHPERGYEQFAYKTIQEWYYNYKNGGLSALEKNLRSDYGKSRSIPPEIGELIIIMKKENYARSAIQIIQELILAGKINKNEISRSSVYRLLCNHKKDIQQYKKEIKEKRRYAFEYSNECWQSDVKHGPYLKIKDYEKRKKVFLFGFIDDASRVIPHVHFSLKENLENFLICFKTAIMKKGIPERVYLDNAGYFRSNVVKKIGARLGIRVMFCSPYSPYQKGKIERFWKTCSEQFLSHLDMERVYTLEELNKLFGTWAETIYHHRIHSSLNASPIETWQKKSQNIRYPDDDAITFEFLHEKIRKVRNDGTFSLNGITYEAEPHFQGQSITVRYDPAQLDKIYIYEQGELYQKSYPVNETENCKTHRQTIISKSETVSSGISFTNLLEQEGDLNV